MDEVKKNMVKLDTEQEIKYEMPKGYSVELFINGYRVNQDYDFDREGKSFRNSICKKNDIRIDEMEILIVVKHGAIKKEISITGYIRKIRTEDWK